MKATGRWMLGTLAAVCLLGADTWITWTLATRHAGTDDDAPAFETVAQDPLDSFRTQREQLRAREEAELNDIIHATNADSSQVDQARARQMTLMQRREQEATLEGVLSARGFGNAVVTISDRSANVLVPGERLTRQETAVILELVMRETGLTGGNVKIIPVK